MSFPDLCCTKKRVVRRLLFLQERYDSPLAFFSDREIAPPPAPFGSAGERGKRAAALAELYALVRLGIVEEDEQAGGSYRLSAPAADFYREALR